MTDSIRTARLRASQRTIPADACTNGAAVRACLRAGIVRIRATTRCSKKKYCMPRKRLIQCVHKTNGCTLYASLFHKHPGVTPSETFVLRFQREEVRCAFGLISFIKLSCKIQVRMRGWQIVETCLASLYLLYSFWTNSLVSTTAAADEKCRSKKHIPAESYKLWMESLGAMEPSWVTP